MGHDVVVIGASAGGVEALKQLVKRLPPDLPAALLVVIHFPATSTSVLPKILNRAGKLPAAHAVSGEPVQPGRIYVAPPDYHLQVWPAEGEAAPAERIYLHRGPRENGSRPAIDALFRSVARTYGSRVIGVILSGALDDGVAGLGAIKARGGLALVQDPEEALVSSMPRHAIANVSVDAVLPIPALADRLVEWVEDAVLEPTILSDPATDDPGNTPDKPVAQKSVANEQGDDLNGNATVFTCPDCGGTLWEFQNDNLLQFRCHVGHLYSLDSLLSGQADQIESALWVSYRTLKEKAAMARRMAARAKEHQQFQSETQFLQQAEEAESHADKLCRVIEQQNRMDYSI